MQSSVILIMISLCIVQIRKDINESYKCKPQHWMETEYDDNVCQDWKLSNGNYTVKLKKKWWIRWWDWYKKDIAFTTRNFK